MIPNRQHMEQMTVGMTSYFLSISKLQASAMADPAPSELSPVGSVIVLNFEALGQAESQDKEGGDRCGRYLKSIRAGVTAREEKSDDKTRKPKKGWPYPNQWSVFNAD